MFVLSFILFSVFILLNAESPNEGKRNTGELSRQKCKEYSQHAPRKCECPHDGWTANGYIFTSLGVDSACDTEFRHVVMMGRQIDGKTKWLCEGSLISDQFILTVAHCLDSSLGTVPEFVRVGVADLNDTQHSQDIKIQETILHPEYKSGTYYNDIGLVKLQRKVQINHNARPACLHTQNEVGSEPAFHTGWGIRGFLDVDSRLERETLDDFRNQSTCNETYLTESGVYQRNYSDIDTIHKKLRNGIVPETMICVGTRWYDINNTVNRGAPLQRYNKEYDCMFDIISVGLIGKVFDNRLLGVFARTSAYIPWIEENVWK